MAGIGLPASSVLNLIPFVEALIFAPIFFYFAYQVFTETGFFKNDRDYLVEVVYLNIYVSAAMIKLVIVFVGNLFAPTFGHFTAEWLVTFLCENIVFTWLTCVLPGYISHSRYSRQVLIYQEQQLKERAAAAQALLSHKEETIRYISHEMRTPIMIASTAIKFAVEDLNTSKDSENIVSTLLDGEQACQASLVILNDMLTYESLNAGKYILHRENVCMFPFLETIVRQNKILCADKNVSLRLTNELKESVYAYIDSTKFEQVFRNLISNSVKFTSSGTTIFVKLSKDLSQFVPKSQDLPIENQERFTPAGSISISITDEGVGISPENIERVFGQFNQFDPHILQGGGGTGLGLFISQKIVQFHGGRINVSSEGVGKGTTFNILIESFKKNQEKNELDDASLSESVTLFNHEGNSYSRYTLFPANFINLTVY
jgi:signal transduction histidine kinase